MQIALSRTFLLQFGSGAVSIVSFVFSIGGMTMPRGLLFGAIMMAVLTDSATACVTRVVVRPVGVITSDDSVSLELQIVTSTSPGHLTQPTTVNVVGFDIFVDVYPEGGPEDSPDSFIENVDLGKLAPGT